MNTLLADEGGNSKLKVLIDGDGMKLLMDVYQEYVSEDDYVEFPKFMHDVDNLLLNARGGRPLTREERAEMNDAPPTKKRGKKKKKKAVAPTPDSNSNSNNSSDNSNTDSSNNEMTSSDTRVRSISQFVANSRRNSLEAA